jgi:hypothetical protein
MEHIQRRSERTRDADSAWAKPLEFAVDKNTKTRNTGIASGIVAKVYRAALAIKQAETAWANFTVHGSEDVVRPPPREVDWLGLAIETKLAEIEGDGDKGRRPGFKKVELHPDFYAQVSEGVTKLTRTYAMQQKGNRACLIKPQRASNKPRAYTSVTFNGEPVLFMCPDVHSGFTFAHYLSACIGGVRKKGESEYEAVEREWREEFSILGDGTRFKFKGLPMSRLDFGNATNVSGKGPLKFNKDLDQEEFEQLLHMVNNRAIAYKLNMVSEGPIAVICGTHTYGLPVFEGVPVPAFLCYVVGYSNFEYSAHLSKMLEGKYKASKCRNFLGSTMPFKIQEAWLTPGNDDVR